MKAFRLSAGLLSPPAGPRIPLLLQTASIPSAQAITIQHQQLRFRHLGLAARENQVPPPTPFVPDVPTFLQLIGRNMKRFAEKIPTWEALFTLTTADLKELGVNPARDRKYLLHWLEKFRNGQYGPGGDLVYVRDGVAALRIGRDLTRDARWVVNVPMGEQEDVATRSPGKTTRELYNFLEETPREEHVIPRQYVVHGAATVSGPFALQNSTEIGGATVRRVEGMWEERRGQKLDGGERRRAEVRFKRRIAEAKAAREAREAAALGIAA